MPSRIHFAATYGRIKVDSRFLEGANKEMSVDVVNLMRKERERSEDSTNSPDNRHEDNAHDEEHHLADP